MKVCYGKIKGRSERNEKKASQNGKAKEAGKAG
jgi:hypothetical protein